MRKKLKAYRKLHHFSKEEMAQKLGISIDEYKQIEKGGDINDKLKKKIKKLLKSKTKKKGSEITLPKGIVDMSKSIDRMTSITTSPIQKMIDQINSPLNQALSLWNVTNIYKQPKIAIDYLKDINSTITIGWNTIDTVSSFYKPIKEATDKQLKAYQGIQAVFGNHSESIKTAVSMQESLLASFTKPTDPLKSIGKPTLFQSLAEKITKNRTQYESYIGFSSKLVNTLSNSAITSSMYSNWVTADNFIKTDKHPSVLDVLSGSSFTLFDDTDTFNEEREIIEQIDNDPELKEQADNFFDELKQIINDDSKQDVDEERIENLYTKFVKWISESFHKSEFEAKRISKKLFKVIPLISISLTLLFTYKNIEAHKQTQKELKDIKSILLKRSAETDQDTNELLEINQKILDRLNSGYSQNMIAIQNVHLRTRRSVKSKIVCVVSAKQEVIILEKKVKWMEVIYVDANDNLPKTGWVWMECFEPQIN
ncbi:MAG: hypothetical protein KDD03_10810 [Gelidibacter sp.]|nr:hypothetical protein [Gelidibacter sp.]